MKNKFSIHSPVFQLILFSSLLVATPFIMLQHFLQEFIGSLSHPSFFIGSFEIVWLPFLALIFLITVIILTRKYITIYRIKAFGFIIFMFVIGQLLSDYYFNHTFYDLQHNWHYFAYGIFAFMAYRVFKTRKMSYSRMILSTFLIALLMSTFDEGFQKYLSSRIFDIGDIAKDAWGVCIGMIFVYFILEQGKMIESWKIHQAKIKGYFTNPISSFFLCVLFALTLLSTSSILTEIRYALVSISLTILFSIFIFLIFHLLQFKISRLVIIILTVFIVITSGVIMLRSENVVDYTDTGIVKYRGLPVLYFDLMIHPNSYPRLVDKKTFFNLRDIKFLKNHAPSILIIGAGSAMQGGNGFAELKNSQFIFNQYYKKGLQVIILDNKNAITEYNRIKNNGKNPLLVIHNE